MPCNSWWNNEQWGQSPSTTLWACVNLHRLWVGRVVTMLSSPFVSPRHFGLRDWFIVFVIFYRWICKNENQSSKGPKSEKNLTNSTGTRIDWRNHIDVWTKPNRKTSIPNSIFTWLNYQHRNPQKIEPHQITSNPTIEHQNFCQKNRNAQIWIRSSNIRRCN